MKDSIEDQIAERLCIVRRLRVPKHLPMAVACDGSIEHQSVAPAGRLELDEFRVLPAQCLDGVAKHCPRREVAQRIELRQHARMMCRYEQLWVEVRGAAGVRIEHIQEI